MKRLAPLCLAIAAAACDPELDIKKGPGPSDGGGSDGATATPSPPSDSGTDDAGDAGATGDAGDAGRAHQIDGVNDFALGERLSTTSGAPNPYYAYASWDAKNVYLGMDGADVAATTANPGSKWVMVYLGLDGVAGTTTGLPYNGSVQQPTLPFSACYHLRWKVDGSYTNVQRWDSGQGKWLDAGVVGVPVLTVARQGTFMEMSFTQASIGSPSKLRVHMNMLIEGSGADWTYAGVPSTSFADAKNPSFTKYYEFVPTDLTAAPSSYAPRP